MQSVSWHERFQFQLSGPHPSTPSFYLSFTQQNARGAKLWQYCTELIYDHVYNKAAICTAHRTASVVLFCILTPNHQDSNCSDWTDPWRCFKKSWRLTLEITIIETSVLLRCFLHRVEEQGRRAGDWPGAGKAGLCHCSVLLLAASSLTKPSR